MDKNQSLEIPANRPTARARYSLACYWTKGDALRAAAHIAALYTDSAPEIEEVEATNNATAFAITVLYYTDNGKVVGE